jgi:hypothetical protein
LEFNRIAAYALGAGNEGSTAVEILIVIAGHFRHEFDHG